MQKYMQFILRAYVHIRISQNFLLLLKECFVNTSCSRLFPMYDVCSFTHNPCPGRWLDFYRCGDDDDADRHGEGKHCLQQLPRRYACFRLPVPSCSQTCIFTCRSSCENFVSISEFTYV